MAESQDKGVVILVNPGKLSCLGDVSFHTSTSQQLSKMVYTLTCVGNQVVANFSFCPSDMCEIISQIFF